jgi:hypothetical protein
MGSLLLWLEEEMNLERSLASWLASWAVVVFS